MQAYVSTSTSPTFNLALEDHLFRTHSLTRSRPPRPPPSDHASPLCLLYRNRPCVVIGRNQNPWKELNIREMARLGIPLVRRRSGGGSVFHDLGNTNYSIHLHKDDFTKRANAELVSRALNELIHPSFDPRLQHHESETMLRTSVYVNHRSDICVRLSAHSHAALPAPDDPTIRPDPPDPLERKISGSAYKLSAHRAYHHGTLLLDANLSQLGSSLRNARGDALQSKGVASVRATVANLVDAFPEARGRLTHDRVAEAVVAEFGRTYDQDNSYSSTTPLTASHVGEEWLDCLGPDSILRESFAELQSWDWLFGQTPEFTHELVARPAQHGRDSDTSISLAPSTSTSPHHDRHNHSADPAPTVAPFPLGTFGLTIRSRRGIIEEARLSGLATASSASTTARSQQSAHFHDHSTQRILTALIQRLEGLRYDDFAEEVPSYLDGRSEQDFPRIRSETAVQARLRHAEDLLLGSAASGGGQPGEEAAAAADDDQDQQRAVAHTFVRWLRDVL
ncbi:hypothetical protein V8E36_003043 [Tilletia maclaganii]